MDFAYLKRSTEISKTEKSKPSIQKLLAKEDKSKVVKPVKADIGKG